MKTININYLLLQGPDHPPVPRGNNANCESICANANQNAINATGCDCDNLALVSIDSILLQIVILIMIMYLIFKQKTIKKFF